MYVRGILNTQVKDVYQNLTRGSFCLSSIPKNHVSRKCTPESMLQLSESRVRGCHLLLEKLDMSLQH